MTTESETALRAEFDAMTARAHLTIAAERREVMFAAFKAQHAVLAELDRPFAYSDEPALTARSKP